MAFCTLLPTKSSPSWTRREMTSLGSTPLRVAMSSYYLPSGSKMGVGYQAHALANALVDRGHTVTVFSSCGHSEGARYQQKPFPAPALAHI